MDHTKTNSMKLDEFKSLDVLDRNYSTVEPPSQVSSRQPINETSISVPKHQREKFK